MPNPLWTCDERLGGTWPGKLRLSAAGDNLVAASMHANQNAVRRIENCMILNLSYGSKVQLTPYNIAAAQHGNALCVDRLSLLDNT